MSTLNIILHGPKEFLAVEVRHYFVSRKGSRGLHPRNLIRAFAVRIPFHLAQINYHNSLMFKFVRFSTSQTNLQVQSNGADQRLDLRPNYCL